MKVIFNEKQITEVAQQLITDSTSKTFCFYGAMGAGKTTLIKALVKELGGGDVANSPTFSIVNEYHHANGELLGYHFDFYRLEDELEALDLGFDEYLDREVWVFIEWPERIAGLLPEERTDIYLEVLDTETRELRFISRQ